MKQHHGVEIERKFLVVDNKWRNEVRNSFNIRQGYLSRESGRTVRVRISDFSAFLTVKGPTDNFSRREFEYEIPYGDGLELLEMCGRYKLSKIRYIIEYEGMVWEVDVFLEENAGLIIAEIELQSEDQTFKLPDWVGEDVTMKRKYYNSNLVSDPYRTWPDNHVVW